MPDVDVEIELELLKELNSREYSDSDMCQVLQTTPNCYPNRHSVLNIFHMVVFTAPNEGSFSSLRHLKT